MPWSMNALAPPRRERRLRAAWRHEQPSVRMALAAAQHHSAPKCAGPETHEAPRGQTTARAAGKRPAPQAEVSEPQEAVTVGYVAAPGPLLSTPLLADTAAENGRPHGEIPPPGRAEAAGEGGGVVEEGAACHR